MEEIPEGCTLVAHDTGEGWALCVENTKGDVVAYLAWPWSWLKAITPEQLAEKGFEVT